MIDSINFNYVLILSTIFGILFNNRNLLIILVNIELMLLYININFLLISVYVDNMIGQVFSLLILTVAAAESAIGIAIIILFYKTSQTLSLTQKVTLRH